MLIVVASLWVTHSHGGCQTLKVAVAGIICKLDFLHHASVIGQPLFTATVSSTQRCRKREGDHAHLLSIL